MENKLNPLIVALLGAIILMGIINYVLGSITYSELASLSTADLSGSVTTNNVNTIIPIIEPLGGSDTHLECKVTNALSGLSQCVNIPGTGGDLDNCNELHAECEDFAVKQCHGYSDSYITCRRAIKDATSNATSCLDKRQKTCEKFGGKFETGKCTTTTTWSINLPNPLPVCSADVSCPFKCVQQPNY